MRRAKYNKNWENFTLILFFFGGLVYMFLGPR